jgi:hypothetical protein
MRIGDYAIDVLQTGDNAVKTVRLKAIAPVAKPATGLSESRG